MQKLSAYNLAQNNNCGLITCSICGRSYRITEFGTDADCQSNSPSASNPNFCPYCASPFERPLTRVRNQEIEDYILDTIRIGMKSDTVLHHELLKEGTNLNQLMYFVNAQGLPAYNEKAVFRTLEKVYQNARKVDRFIEELEKRYHVDYVPHDYLADEPDNRNL